MDDIRAPILDIERVSASYGQRRVFADVSLRVAQGEVFGLIGLNGVGKTTLIKAILSLVHLDGGSVRIGGIDHQRPESRSNLAFLPERFQPPRSLSGFEFVEFALSYYGLKMDRSAVLASADSLGLEREALGRRVATYSKGMGQKLGLLSTLMTGRRLLVLDEPMSGLDPEARILLKDELMRFRSRDHTIFLSSHILNDLDELCDRIAILHDGRLLFVGAPETLKAEAGAMSLERAFLMSLGRPVPPGSAANEPAAGMD